MTSSTLPPPRGSGPAARTTRPVPLVIGIVLALVGLPLLLGGLGLGWALGTQRDSDGFFTTGTGRLTTSTPALAVGDLTVVIDGPEAVWSGRDLATLRISATSADGSGVFVGVAPTADLEAYLDPAGYDRVDTLRGDPFRYTVTRHGSGTATLAPPGDQSFWTTSSSGPGTQTVVWSLEPGTYSAVLMNEDGTPGVTVDAVAGARSGLLVPVAWALGVVGLLVIVAGALLVVLGATPPAPRGSTDLVRAGAAVHGAAPVDTPVRLTGVQDPALSRWLWLVKWLLAIPHFIVLVLLWVVFTVLTVIAFVAILVTGRYPRSLFDVNVGILRWTWRVQFYATSAIGTDRYPPFTLARTDYPADLDVAYPERLSRGLVLVKWWLLALPQLIIISVLAGAWTFGNDNGVQVTVTGLIGALTLAAGLLLLFTGRYPASLFDFVVGLDRWVYRVVAYVALMTDTYPPFRLDAGPDEPGRVPPAPGGSGPASTALGPSGADDAARTGHDHHVGV
jgi:hypothetical protein